MAPLIVSTLNDELAETRLLGREAADGDGLSLREALAIVQAEPERSMITFAPELSGGRVVLRNGALETAVDVQIDGDLDNDGRPDIQINGRGANRILESTDSDVSLTGLAIENGYGVSRGGALLSEGGHLEITSSRFVNNAAYAEFLGVIRPGSDENGDASGGAIFSTGSVSISDSQFFRNMAYVVFNTPMDIFSCIFRKAERFTLLEL